MTLELNEHEREVLTALLEREHQNRLHELFRTDSISYKQMLREKVSIIEGMSAKLAETLVTS